MYIEDDRYRNIPMLVFRPGTNGMTPPRHGQKWQPATWRGPTYEKLPGAVDAGTSESTALAAQNTGIVNVEASPGREAWHCSRR